jgi:tetratricopeptide (TPR) repeat protein
MDARLKTPLYEFGSFRLDPVRNPNYATAHHWYAESLLYQGRFEEAGQEIERAYALDPVSPIINTERAAVLLWKGQTSEAIERYQKALELEPGFTVALYGLGLCYEKQSQYEAAIAAYKQMRSITAKGCLGYLYAVTGRQSEARMVLKELQEMSTEQYIPAYLMAMIYSGLGEKERALANLELAYQEREARLVLLKIDPHFDRMRSDAKFQELLRRIQLT